MIGAFLDRDGRVLEYSLDNINGVKKLYTSITDSSLKEILGDSSGFKIIDEISSNHTSMEEKGFRYVTKINKLNEYIREKEYHEDDVILYRKTKHFEIFVGITKTFNVAGLDFLCYGRKNNEVKVSNSFKIDEGRQSSHLLEELIGAEKYVEKVLLNKAA